MEWCCLQNCCASSHATSSHAQSHDAQLHCCNMFTAPHLSAAIMGLRACTRAWAVLVPLVGCSLQQRLLPPYPSTTHRRHNWVMQALPAGGTRSALPHLSKARLGDICCGCRVLMQACPDHCRQQVLGPPLAPCPWALHFEVRLTHVRHASLNRSCFGPPQPSSLP